MPYRSNSEGGATTPYYGRVVDRLLERAVARTRKRSPRDGKPARFFGSPQQVVEELTILDVTGEPLPGVWDREWRRRGPVHPEQASGPLSAGDRQYQRPGVLLEEDVPFLEQAVHAANEDAGCERSGADHLLAHRGQTGLEVSGHGRGPDQVREFLGNLWDHVPKEFGLVNPDLVHRAEGLRRMLDEGRDRRVAAEDEKAVSHRLRNQGADRLADRHRVWDEPIQLTFRDARRQEDRSLVHGISANRRGVRF